MDKEALSKLRKEVAIKKIEDLDGLIERITEPLTKCQIYELAEAGGHGSTYVIRKNWSQIESHLVKTKNRYLKKPIK